MGLILKIDNETRLPDGGPLTYALNGTRGADIGRDAHLDWTLPDPSRQISGKHCEIRSKDGSYWLYDVSRNGTFLDGTEGRIQSPHRLRSGDRLVIGHYIVSVEVTGEAAVEPRRGLAPSSHDGDDPWSVSGDAPAPIDKRELRPPSDSVPVRADWLEWAVEVPGSADSGFVLRPTDKRPAPSPPPEPSWDSGPPVEAPAPELAAPVPTPRRSIWVSPPPDGPWEGGEEPGAEPAVEAPRPAPLPIRAAPPPPAPAASAAQGAYDDALGRFARGAGIPAEMLAPRDAGAFAERLGRLMLLVIDNVKQLLAARQQTKVFARASNPTMIAALDNNPLKFSPSPADALKIMLGSSTTSYLEAETALQQSFDDIKSHQIKTFAAMQHALKMLVEDLEPSAIESSVGRPKGMSAWFGLHRGRLWDVYETRWKAKTHRSGGGMQEVFMHYFAECYDRLPDPAAEHRRSNRQ